MSGASTRLSSVPRRPFAALAAMVVVAALGVSIPGGAAGAKSRTGRGPSGKAPGGPGAQAYLDEARKDCFGTTRDSASKVWFTVAGGVLSDVFSPTLENTNVKTLQYLVTDGRTFTALQQRDMTYAVSSPDRSGMVCRVTSTDRAHRFRLVSDYITDPARDSVVVRTSLEPLSGLDGRSIRDLKIYVRYNATVDNTGGGGAKNGGPNNATVDPATTALVSSDTKTPKGPFSARVVGALVANRPFLSESSGFVGTPSDGLGQLDTYHRLMHDYRSADDGNVVQTARIAVRPGQPFTLALGFAPTAQRAIATAHRSALEPFDRTLARYVASWRRYDGGLSRAAQAPGRPLSRARGRHGPDVLAFRQRDQGRRGQDQRRRVRRVADRPLGSIRSRRHHPRRLDISRSVRSGQLRDLHWVVGRWGPDQRPGHGRGSCSTAFSSATGAFRATPSSMAQLRPTRSACRRSTRIPIRC